MQNVQARILFNAGLKEVISRLEPSQVILYGVIDDDIRDKISGIPYIHLDSNMKQRIDAYKNKLENS